MTGIRAFQGIMPQIGARVFVADSALILGDVSLGDDVSIWFQCVLRGDVNWIEIGARSNVQDGCILHVTHRKYPLLLEEDVAVAHKVMLHGCTLRKGCLVGMSSTLMDGVEVGEGCLVAAGSLLKEGFVAPPHTLVAGWPAQVKGELNSNQKELVAGIAARYVRYKEAYFQDGWPMAQSTSGSGSGFRNGHPYP